MKIAILNKEDARKACGLLEHYEFNDYRIYRMLNKDCLRKYLSGSFMDSVKLKDNLVIIAQDNNKAVGLAAVVFLPWDTKHFGVKMAKIDYFMTLGSYRQAVTLKESLLSSLIKLCRDKGFVYLSCRIDAGDICGVHALEKNGFLLMDTIVTYVFNRHKHHIPDIRGIHKIRLFRESDLPALLDIAGRAFSKDRFHLDTHISPKKSNSLFKEWVKDSCAKKDSNKVFVAQKGAEVTGFLAFELNKELERLSGYKIAGHGLSAVSPQAKGAYISLVKAAVEDIALHYDCLEFDTQLNNYEVTRVWQKFDFDCIRVKHTFHRWIKK